METDTWRLYKLLNYVADVYATRDVVLVVGTIPTFVRCKAPARLMRNLQKVPI